MSYGGYLDSGLAAIPGARYAADPLRVPQPSPFTQTAHGGTLRTLYGAPPRMRTKIYGEIPVHEIEGHQVDPFYDVRGGGLGQVPTMLHGRGGIQNAVVRGRVDNATPPVPDEMVLGPTEAPFSWIALGVGAILFGRVLGLGKIMKGR